MHRPGGVAEEPLDLPDDVGQREAGERTSREMSNRSMALMRPISPTWTTSSMSWPRLRNRRAANCTSDMVISMRVLRAYWYSAVPSSSTASRSRNSADSSRASWGRACAGSRPVAVPDRRPPSSQCELSLSQVIPALPLPAGWPAPQLPYASPFIPRESVGAPGNSAAAESALGTQPAP